MTEEYWNAVVSPRVAAARAEREFASRGQAQLVAAVEHVLFRADPIGINVGTNADEYRAEAQSIVIRLPDATSESGVVDIVHAVFVTWFDSEIAGPAERYAPVAREIWSLWNRAICTGG
ncbi:hypothetical protein [Leifsonia sp. PS1209]|uniref:hypothetical protein n=1 Tax=Leifsonia sp. PS1209 TaxID=2724914 RepID=UPI001B33A4D5|nr:hypothetical protein [Leifsonia sp. PS1209]